MLDVINTRRSVRKWRTDPVSEADIRDILEAAMNAPSAGNEQAWQLIVLTGSALDGYLAANGNVAKGAPVGILVCGDKKAQKYDGFFPQDCAAATQNILLAVHTKGLGGVWTTVFPTNVDAVRKLLGLPEDIVPFSFVPFGYPDMKAEKAISRYDEKKVHRNKW
jgi:nitroreductase